MATLRQFTAESMLCVPQVELDCEACNVQGTPAPVRGGKDNKAACRGGIATLKNVHLDTQSAGAYTIRCNTGKDKTAFLPHDATMLPDKFCGEWQCIRAPQLWRSLLQVR